MRIAVLGTGMVGQAHAGKLSQLGHEVIVGTRDVKKALARTEGGQMTEAFGKWIKDYKKVKVATFSDAAKQGELIIEALSGDGALKVLKSIKKELQGKTLIDISNPLDFSKGMPASLFVSNTNSLAEQIQAALPKTRVVKAFNTMNATVQVDPKSLAKGDHHLFIAGNDPVAKAQVAKLAKSYGWKNILDLGDIKAARGMEMILPIWLQIFGALKTANFNFKITH